MDAVRRIWNGFSPLLRGTLLFITALFLFSIMDILAKALTLRHQSLQVVWARYTSQSVIAFIVAAPYLNVYLRTRYPFLQLVRSSCLFGATCCFFTAIKFLPLGSATAIFEIAPLFITAASFFILREKVGMRRWIGVFLGLIGAMIIIRPGSEVFSPYALLPAFAAAFFAGYAISTRFLGREESPWTSFLYTALIGTIASSFIVPFVWQTPSLPDAGRMATMGVVGGLGHFVLIRAFTMAEASVLAPFGYLTLIFNGLWAYLLFSENPDTATILGAAVIVVAGVYVWHRETFATPAKLKKS